MSRFLLVCHDAGGTIPPMVAIAEALRARRHDVWFLSQPSVRARAAVAGAGFLELSDVGDYRPRVPLEEQLDVVVEAIAGRSVADDVVATAGRIRADAVVVDANLASALAAAETLPVPTAVLLHSMWATFVDVWFGELWGLLADLVNRTRRSLGLDAASDWPDVFSRHERIISAVPPLFDAGPEPQPATLRHAGFLVPRPTATIDIGYPAGSGPRVLVGLSTTYQRHDSLLHRICAALETLPVRALVTTAGQVDGPVSSAAVRVVERLPHSAVLPTTDVMVTHGGLGSVAAALSAGVPLVCTPLGRDQPLNAGRVRDLGAGLVVDSDGPPDELATAIASVLDDRERFGVAAGSVARASIDAGGAAGAALDLERLVSAL